MWSKSNRTMFQKLLLSIECAASAHQREAFICCFEECSAAEGSLQLYVPSHTITLFLPVFTPSSDQSKLFVPPPVGCQVGRRF